MSNDRTGGAMELGRRVRALAGAGLLATTLLAGCEDKPSVADETSGPKTAAAATGSAVTSADTSASKTIASSTSMASASTSSAPSAALPEGHPFRHIAADCEVVVTSDLAKVRAHPAFAKEIQPKLEAFLNASPKDPNLVRILTEAKLAGFSAKSPHSLAVCVKPVAGAPKPSFGFLIGSDLKPGTFASLVEKVATPDDKTKLKDLDGAKVLSSPKVTMGQLSDGVFALTDREDVFKSLMPTRDVLKINVDVSKEISFFVAESIIQKELAKPGAKGAELFGDMTSLRGHVDLSTNKIVLRATCKSDAAALKIQAMVILAKDKLAQEKLPDNPFGAADMVRAIDAKAEGNVVTLETTIPPKTLEDGAKVLGAQLEAILKKP